MKKKQPKLEHVIVEEAASLLEQGAPLSAALELAHDAATAEMPVAFFVEVLRPKKGIEYAGGFETLDEAEAYIRKVERKKPKWRCSLLKAYRMETDICPSKNGDDLARKQSASARLAEWEQRLGIAPVPVCDLVRQALELGWVLNDKNHLCQPAGPLLAAEGRWAPLQWEDKLIYIPVDLQRALQRQQRDQEAACSAAEQH